MVNMELFVKMNLPIFEPHMVKKAKITVPEMQEEEENVEGDIVDEESGVEGEFEIIE
jgi:hypothetical protein